MSLQESIILFMDIISSTPDFPSYTNYVEKIKNLRRYVVTIPNSVRSLIILDKLLFFRC